MNKRILISLSVIGAVAAIAIGGTVAYFSDTETSKGNTISAGVIDIVVDGKNPWTKTFTDKLTDMKPSYTRYIEFTVRNLKKSNEVVLWNHINITDRDGGVMTEPECEEEGGTWASGVCTGNTPRDNLDPYIIYDMYVCQDPGPEKCKTDENGKPTGPDWIPIIKEDQYVRLDNVNSAWIRIGQLNPAKSLKVVQSYHLSSWPGAQEPDVTNWAQGDTLTFDIELMATQLNAPGPKGYFATLNMDNKDPNTWNPITTDDISAQLTYKTSGNQFDYALSGKVKNASTDYCLIYYADPYPGDGTDHTTGALIGKATSGSDRNISIPNTTVELGTDLPNIKDQNYPAGAKIWLVPCADYSTSNIGSQGKLTGWHPTEYLFEMQFISYEDTNN